MMLIANKKNGEHYATLVNVYFVVVVVDDEEEVLCVTEQHYVSIFFTFLHSFMVCAQTYAFLVQG